MLADVQSFASEDDVDQWVQLVTERTEQCRIARRGTEQHISPKELQRALVACASLTWLLQQGEWGAILNERAQIGACVQLAAEALVAEGSPITSMKVDEATAALAPTSAEELVGPASCPADGSGLESSPPLSPQALEEECLMRIRAAGLRHPPVLWLAAMLDLVVRLVERHWLDGLSWLRHGC